MQHSEKKIHPLSDEAFETILQNCWEQLALFAFQQFRASGRGAVFISRHGLSDDLATDHVDIKYVAYTQECPDPQVSRVINDYDPRWEIVCQYERPDDSIRTARVRTGTGNRHPERIFLFDRLAQGETE
jgi:hypothetical protein